MAVEIGFYHCTRAPVLETAVRLAAKALDSGQRLLVVGDKGMLAALDTALWEQIPDSFLAHGEAGGADDAQQPILLSGVVEPANGAGLLMLLEQGIPGDLAAFSRLLSLFADGSEAHARARLDWKALADREGVTRSYWQQTPRGGWEKRG